VRIFLGITGASGAPYAVRLLQALLAAECEVGVCASGAGIEVIGTEVYGDPRLPRDEVLARLTEGAEESVTVYDPWVGPPANAAGTMSAANKQTMAPMSSLRNMSVPFGWKRRRAVCARPSS